MIWRYPHDFGNPIAPCLGFSHEEALETTGLSEFLQHGDWPRPRLSKKILSSTGLRSWASPTRVWCRGWTCGAAGRRRAPWDPNIVHKNKRTTYIYMWREREKKKERKVTIVTWIYIYILWVKQCGKNITIVTDIMWVKQWHKPPMTGKGKHTTYKFMAVTAEWFMALLYENYLNGIWTFSYGNGSDCG